VEIEVAESESTWSEENAEDTMLLRLVIITGPIVIVIIIIQKKMQWGSIIVSLLCALMQMLQKQPKQWQSLVAMLSRDCWVWELG
jgi:hypothetical protein